MLITDEERKLIERIKSERQEASSANDNAGIQSKLLSYRKLAENVYEPSEDDKRKYGKDISIPEAASQFKSIVLKICSPFLAARGEWLFAEPENEESIENSKWAETSLRHYSDEMKFQDTLYDYVYCSVRDGSGFLKGGWMRKFNPNLEKEISPNSGTLSEEGPTAEICLPENLYLDPKASRIEDCEYVIHEQFMRKEQIIALMDSAELDASRKDLLEDMDVKTRCENFNQGYKHEITPGQFTTEISTTPFKYRVTERWTLQKVAVVVNDALILRNDENPYKNYPDSPYPFFAWQYWKVPGKTFGESFFENIKDFQYGLNVIINTLLDNMAITTKPTIMMEKDMLGEEERDRFRMGVGEIWEVERGSTVEPVQIPSQSGELWNTFQSFRQMMMQATSSTDQMRGFPDAKQETASAATMRAQASQAFFNFIISDLCESLKLFWKFTLRNVQRYQVLPARKRKKDDEGNYSFENIGRDKVAGSFDLNVEVDVTGTSRNLKTEQMMKFLNLAGAADFVDSRELIKRIGENLDIKQMDRIVLTDDKKLMKKISSMAADISVQSLAPQLQAFFTSKTPEEFAQKFNALLGGGGQMPGAGGIPPGAGIPPGGQLAPDAGGRMPGGNIDSMQDMMRAYAPKVPANEEEYMIQKAEAEGE